MTGSRVEVVTHREGAGGTKAASPLPRARPTPTPLCLAGLLWAFKTPEGEKAGQFSDELKAHSRGKAVPSAAALRVSRVSRRESRRFRQVLSAAQAGPFIPVFLGRSHSLLGVTLKTSMPCSPNSSTWQAPQGKNIQCAKGFACKEGYCSVICNKEKTGNNLSVKY